MTWNCSLQVQGALINFHNYNARCDENHHAIVESKFQNQFSLNFWIVIVGDYLIGQHLFSGTITANWYHNLLEFLYQNYLKKFDFYMHGGAPEPFSFIIPNNFWPPTSPDLIAIDSLWEHLKSLVHVAPIITKKTSHCWM